LITTFSTAEQIDGDVKKSKFHPIASLEGPEGKQGYSFTLSLTCVLDGDG